jgi:hypothetical protein
MRRGGMRVAAAFPPPSAAWLRGGGGDFTRCSWLHRGAGRPFWWRAAGFFQKRVQAVMGNETWSTSVVLLFRFLDEHPEWRGDVVWDPHVRRPFTGAVLRAFLNWASAAGWVRDVNWAHRQARRLQALDDANERDGFPLLRLTGRCVLDDRHDRRFFRPGERLQWIIEQLAAGPAQ